MRCSNVGLYAFVLTPFAVRTALVCSLAQCKLFDKFNVLISACITISREFTIYVQSYSESILIGTRQRLYTHSPSPSYRITYNSC